MKENSKSRPCCEGCLDHSVDAIGPVLIREGHKIFNGKLTMWKENNFPNKGKIPFVKPAWPSILNLPFKVPSS